MRNGVVLKYVSLGLTTLIKFAQLTSENLNLNQVTRLWSWLTFKNACAQLISSWCPSQGVTNCLGAHHFYCCAGGPWLLTGHVVMVIHQYSLALKGKTSARWHRCWASYQTCLRRWLVTCYLRTSAWLICIGPSLLISSSFQTLNGGSHFGSPFWWNSRCLTLLAKFFFLTAFVSSD